MLKDERVASTASGMAPSEPEDYFSLFPFEIRTEIYRCCDALTLHLNWTEASVHLPVSIPAPTPLEAWIAVLQSDCAVDIAKMPLVARDPRYVSDNDTGFCLPDASILCRYIRSKTMLRRIMDAKLPVSNDVFSNVVLYGPSQSFAVHVAMRHCWHDLVDGFNMPEVRIEEFAIRGSHWEYFQFLVGQRPSLSSQYDRFFDNVAWNGDLALLQRLPVSITGTTKAMDWAARNGHIDIVRWLHSNRNVGCSGRAMTFAAQFGHVDVVKFLHMNRSEGDVQDAIDLAGLAGQFHIVQYLEGKNNQLN